MVYNLGIYLLRFGIWLLSFFDKKIRKGELGRNQTFRALEQSISKKDRVIWFHCASLGEYEQGLPVFKRIREQYRDHKIILSFFSPSGYDNKKNSEIADLSVYLPIDTPNNAKRFIEFLKPELSIFVRYDIWPNYLCQLETHSLKSVLISARFRDSQLYFKWYGKTLRKALLSFDHIFVQDKKSQDLLKSIDYNHSLITGDTRFDRVSAELESEIDIPWLNSFKGENPLIIFGSTWPEDEKLILDAINTLPIESLKILIAPHEIHNSHIIDIKSQLKKPTIEFTEIGNQELENYSVILLNTIGLLAKTYSYADIAYIGGAVGKTGLHNILEPAVFGVPIITGENISRFPEAIDLKNRGGLFTVSSPEALKKLLESFLNNSSLRQNKGDINKIFVKENKGAVIQIMDMIRI